MSTPPSDEKLKVYVRSSPDISSSTFVASGLTNDEVLDSLFEDNTTVGLGLPPISELLRPDSPNFAHDLGTQKRKFGSFASDEDLDNAHRGPPPSKVTENIDEKMVKENERKGKEASRIQDNRAFAASTRPSIEMSKYVPTGHERRDEVKLLAMEHVRHVAPTMLANIESNRDVEGKKNKFDWAESRREIPKEQIKAPDYHMKKWVDKNDGDITWLIVPVSLEAINMGGSMIPVVDIVSDPIKHPEFTFVEEIMSPHKKTGKEAVKAYKLKYEKMDGEQSILRADRMIKQQREEKKQVRKEEAVRRRNTKRAGPTDEALEDRAAAKEQRKKKARAQAGAEKGGFF